MSFEFTDRITSVEPSATLSIGNRAADLESQGVDVIDLSVGEPDFRTPEVVVEAAKAALDAGHHGYTPTNGIPALREAIAGYLGGLGLDYGPGNVIVTPGAKQALYETVQTLVDVGDEVVLLDPAWVSYEAMVKLAGGRPRRVDLSPYGFRLEPAIDEVASAVNDETALVIVNSPANPTGRVYSEAALEGLRDVVVGTDTPVISDEIYREIAYTGAPTSLGALDGMAERVITVNGFSKTYAMTGWRLGYLAAPEALVGQAGKLHSHSVSCAPNAVQHAGIAALDEAGDAVDDMVDRFEVRRDRLLALLETHGIDIQAPEGAFYLMVPVANDDAAWCERAIDEAHVATVPGHAFGAPGFARVSYAASTDRLEEGIDRLVEADLL